MYQKSVIFIENNQKRPFEKGLNCLIYQLDSCFSSLVNDKENYAADSE